MRMYTKALITSALFLSINGSLINSMEISDNTDTTQKLPYSFKLKNINMLLAQHEDMGSYLNGNTDNDTALSDASWTTIKRHPRPTDFLRVIADDLFDGSKTARFFAPEKTRNGTKNVRAKKGLTPTLKFHPQYKVITYDESTNFLKVISDDLFEPTPSSDLSEASSFPLFVLPKKTVLELPTGKTQTAVNMINSLLAHYSKKSFKLNCLENLNRETVCAVLSSLYLPALAQSSDSTIAFQLICQLFLAFGDNVFEKTPYNRPRIYSSSKNQAASHIKVLRNISKIFPLIFKNKRLLRNRVQKINTHLVYERSGVKNVYTKHPGIRAYKACLPENIIKACLIKQ